MSINFIVNDPGVQGAQAQLINPAPDRPATRITFAISQLPPEQAYAQETAEFVVWQAREAALRALSTFETIAGSLVGWTGKPSMKKLALIPNDGQDLNAYYNRASVSFFEFPLGQRTLFSGASTDVVAHEVGHAILDALRPDLWDVQMVEVPAFHEGFGDCIAIMTALSDQSTRVAILQNDPTLGTGNFVEATAEDLSFGVGKALGPNHNAAKPRHALNTFRWALPQSLPDDGKPGVLINEIHSFGQLTSGCYYELIREIFRAGPGGEQGLWQACQTATKLLALAVAAAPVRARFLETVGRTMILVDRNQHNGANEAFIRTAFQQHGIALSVTNFLAPRVALSTPQTRAKAGRRTGQRRKSSKTAASRLTARAKQMLHALLEVGPKARLSTRSFAPTDQPATEVVALRSVDLTGLSEHLTNVKAYTPYSALVGSSGGAPVVLGAIDAGAIISSEVRDYVQTLVRRGQIQFGAPSKRSKRSIGKKSKQKRAKGSAGFISVDNRPTHALKREGGEVVIERIRFSCGCPPSLFRCVNF